MRYFYRPTTWFPVFRTFTTSLHSGHGVLTTPSQHAIHVVRCKPVSNLSGTACEVGRQWGGMIST